MLKILERNEEINFMNVYVCVILIGFYYARSLNQINPIFGGKVNYDYIFAVMVIVTMFIYRILKEIFCYASDTLNEVTIFIYQVLMNFLKVPNK